MNPRPPGAALLAAALLCHAAGAGAAEGEQSNEVIATTSVDESPWKITTEVIGTFLVDEGSWKTTTDKPPPIHLKADGNIESSEFVQYAEERLDDSLSDESGIITRIGRQLRNQISSWFKPLRRERIRESSLCGESDPGCRRNAEDSIHEVISRLVESQSQRFLFPPGYSPEERSFSEEHLNELTKSLSNSTSCDQLVQTADSFLFGPSEAYRLILAKTKSLAHCQEDMLAQIWQILSDNPFPDNCDGLVDARDVNVCMTMVHNHKTIRERTSALIDTIQLEEAVSPEYPCPPQEPTMGRRGSLAQSPFLYVMGRASIRLISSFLHAYHGQQCMNYSIGDQRIHQGDVSSYRVTKTAPGAYTASIALKFVPSDDYDNKDVPDHQVHDHYLQRVRDCMEDINRYMLGPGGTRLSISVQDASRESPDLAPIKQISIKNSNSRSNVENYESDIDCQIIAHEVLHLLGLPDEYEVRHRGTHIHVENGDMDTTETTSLPSFNCRVVQRNSIMADQGERFRSVRDGKNDSLLDPAHFNSILYPGCQSRRSTRLYRECSSLAYTTNHMGPDHTCTDPRKERCEQSNVLGRNKKLELDSLYEARNYIETQFDIIQNIFYNNTNHFLQKHKDILVGPIGEKTVSILERLSANPGSIPTEQEIAIVESALEIPPPDSLEFLLLRDLGQIYNNYVREKSWLDEVRRRIENVESWD